MRHVTDWLCSSWKYLRSFRKQNWVLEDYPVRVEYFPDVLERWVFNGEPLRAELHPNVIDRQLCSPAWAGTWFAHVLNWPEMSRFGDSAKEALTELRVDFDEWKAAGQPLPRPGVCPPIEQPYAPRMAEHPELAVDFFHRILNLDYSDYWVSDEARLGDFHDDETNDRYVERILLTYGVKVSDIAAGPVVAILDRLVAAYAWSGPK